MEAIDSEHSKNLQSDSRRMYHLQKSLSDPGHPYNSFATGDLSTLDKPGARHELRRFWERHYVADAMCLAVVTAKPPEEAIRLIETTMDAVPSRADPESIAGNTKARLRPHAPRHVIRTWAWHHAFSARRLHEAIRAPEHPLRR